MPIELIIFIVFIVCLIPLIILFRPKVDDYKYTSSENYDDAHELAEKARRDHGQTSVLKAKSSSSAKTTMKESAKKSVAKKHKKHNLTPPLTVKEMRIDIDTKEYADRYSVTGYTHQCVVKLSGKCNIFQIYENNSLRREFELGTVEGEDFSGKYFHLALRIHTSNTYCGPVHLVQTDGFISDTPEDKQMQLSDIGYRMECFPLHSSAEEQYMCDQIIDRDLENKGLRYPGVTTPLNVRLIGWCPSCQRSFTFLSYALYNAQEEVAYSDDGLDVCGIEEYEIDKENWARTADGKIFRYYNPFRCPHCGKPYIDYKKHRYMKRFGNAACALLGKKPYSSSEMEIYIEEKTPESE